MNFLAQITSNDTAFIGVVSTMIGGLVSAIVFLFKLFIDEKKTTRADLQECRSDREKLWAKIETLQNEIGKLLRS